MLVNINAKLSADSILISSFDGLQAILWDSDLLSNQKLASAPITLGQASFLFELDDASGGSSPFESKPDLYITVSDTHGRLLFKSTTMQNADFLQKDAVSGDAKTTLNLIFA